MPAQVTKYRIRQLFSTLADATTANPILLEGEVWSEKDEITGRSTGRRKTGDGSIAVPSGVITGTAFNDLPFDPTSAASLVAYIHNQASASFIWTINHNLGYKPSVTVFNSGGQQVFATVDHPTVNQVVVTSNISFTGTARLI